MAKKPFRWGFAIFALVYALLILAAGYFALSYLWDYAAAYEMSRPYHAIDAYMEALTPDYISDRSEDLINAIDHHIQSEEACRAVIANAVSGGVTYAKKASECTEDKMVYVLRTGNRVIGRVELVTQGESVMGFTPWAVASDSYDLSYLLTDTVSVTVPESFRVSVNGAQLTEAYRTEEGIRFSYLEDFYEDYTLPTIVSYTAGPCLGEISLTVENADGAPVVIDDTTDLNSFLDNCTPETVARLDSFMNDFVKSYIRFTNSSADVARLNYNMLMGIVRSGSPLAKRCKDALGALRYGASQRYKIKSVAINWCTDIGDGRYLCDVTYVVDIRVSGEMVENIFNMKIVVVEQEGTLLAETLRNY